MKAAAGELIGLGASAVALASLWLMTALAEGLMHRRNQRRQGECP